MIRTSGLRSLVRQRGWKDPQNPGQQGGLCLGCRFGELSRSTMTHFFTLFQLVGTTDDGCLSARDFSFRSFPRTEWSAALATTTTAWAFRSSSFANSFSVGHEQETPCCCAFFIRLLLSRSLILRFSSAAPCRNWKSFPHFCGGSCLWPRPPFRSDLQWPRPVLLYGFACTRGRRVVRSRRPFLFFLCPKIRRGKDDCVWQRDYPSDQTH